MPATATGLQVIFRIGCNAGRVGKHWESRTVDDRRDSTAFASLGRGVSCYGTPPVARVCLDRTVSDVVDAHVRSVIPRLLD